MSVREFWNEAATRASWVKLTEIAKQFDFILIGGWAVYLWTKAHKSKDIDIVVDYKTLDALKSSFGLVKNERLKKYEIKQDSFDIDVYVSHYSRLAVPVDALAGHAAKIEGISTVVPEMLVMLKQGAEIERGHSIKGRKDSIDLLTLLIYSGFDLKKYRAMLREFKLERYEDELGRVVRSFSKDDLPYLGMNHQEFVKWKRAFLEKLKLR
jgi:hypothetical protein